MKIINPYVGFNGRCREAMNFYQECMGGKPEFTDAMFRINKKKTRDISTVAYFSGKRKDFSVG